MKKTIVNVLTVCLVLLFALSSCSLDSALEALRGNKYIEWGWTEADTTNVDAVNDAITNIKTDNTAVVDDESGELDLSAVDENSGLYAIWQATEALGKVTGGDVKITLDDKQQEAVKGGVLGPARCLRRDHAGSCRRQPAVCRQGIHGPRQRDDLYSLDLA